MKFDLARRVRYMLSSAKFQKKDVILFWPIFLSSRGLVMTGLQTTECGFFIFKKDFPHTQSMRQKENCSLHPEPHTC